MGLFSKPAEKPAAPRDAVSGKRKVACRTCGYTHPETDCPRWPSQHDGKRAKRSR